MSKGWFKESYRHSQAAKGIRTGTKENAVMNMLSAKGELSKFFGTKEYKRKQIKKPANMTNDELLSEHISFLFTKNYGQVDVDRYNAVEKEMNKRGILRKQRLNANGEKKFISNWQTQPLTKMTLNDMRDTYVEIETDKAWLPEDDDEERDRIADEIYNEAQGMTKSQLLVYLRQNDFI